VREIKSNVLDDIYRRYSKTIFLYIYSLCRKRTLAEDLTQDTFYKAMLSFEDGDILPWLYKVARNLYFDYCRKTKRESVSDAGELPDDSDVLQTVISSEKNRILYERIQLLKKPEREAVMLYYFGGLKQQNIAGHMGISHSSVRILLHRARRKLYESMKEE
jgi:RNA polymerase sigma-70 factor (ECF subfamily)